MWLFYSQILAILGMKWLYFLAILSIFWPFLIFLNILLLHLTFWLFSTFFSYFENAHLVTLVAGTSLEFGAVVAFFSIIDNETGICPEFGVMEIKPFLEISSKCRDINH